MTWPTPGGRVGDASPLGTHGPRRLDDYVRAVAHALMRKRHFSRGHAIATAKNALKRWRRGGGHVRPQVRAGAAAHLGVQEALDKRGGGSLHNLSDDQLRLVDLAMAEADRRAFLDFAQAAGLDDGEIELAATHVGPYRYRHGWIPIVPSMRVSRTGPAGYELRRPFGIGAAKVEPDAHLKTPAARHERKAMEASIEATRRKLAAAEVAPSRRSTKSRVPAELAPSESRRKQMVDAARREQSRRAAMRRKYDAAAREAARRQAAHLGLYKGPGEAMRVPGTYTQQSARFKVSHVPLGVLASGAFSEEQSGALDLALVEAAGRDLDLAPHWRHGWIPLNEEALAIKLKRAAGGGGGPAKKDSFGKFRSAAQNDLSHIKSPEALDRIYNLHVAETDRRLIELNKTHSTHLTHAIDKGDGTLDWSKDPERAAMHARIVNNVFRRMTKTAKKERKALFLGGLPGAGKSSSIPKLPGVNENDYVTVNPDIFKEELAKHGLVPKIPGMAPMEASGLVHEESSHLAGLLADKARRGGYNILHDITMNSEGSVHKRLNPLEADGYTSRAAFVDIPFEMSQDRVKKRHRSGWERHIRDTSGTNLGQRLVPSSHVNTGRSKKGSSSANFDAFQGVKHRFGASIVIDNSGKEPRVVERNGSW